MSEEYSFGTCALCGRQNRALKNGVCAACNITTEPPDFLEEIFKISKKDK